MRRGTLLLSLLSVGLLTGCAVTPRPPASKTPASSLTPRSRVVQSSVRSSQASSPEVEPADLASDSLVPNFHVVHPWLWRGAAPTPEGIRRLKASGVATVIDLRISPRKVRAERRLVEALGMRFLNLPMSGDPPTARQIETFLWATTAPDHPRVFVHCQHGADRTGTMVGLYRERVDGWEFDPTYREMRRYGFDPHWKRLKATVRSAVQKDHGPRPQEKVSLLQARPLLRPASSFSNAEDTDSLRASPAYAVVLVWHDVVPKRQVWFDTPTALFQAQLEAIRRAGCHVLSLESFLRHLTQHTPLPSRPLVLTFDDNNRGLYENAFPLLKRCRYPAALFVHTDYVGIATSKAHCTWEQLREMQQSGLITVQSLTGSHPPDLRRFSDAEIGEELRRSRAAIEQHLGTPVYAFVYPEDRHDARVARLVARAGYKIAFTEDWGNAAASPDRMRVHRYSILKRFDQALADLKRAWPSSGNGV